MATSTATRLSSAICAISGAAADLHKNPVRSTISSLLAIACRCHVCLSRRARCHSGGLLASICDMYVTLSFCIAEVQFSTSWVVSCWQNPCKCSGKQQDLRSTSVLLTTVLMLWDAVFISWTEQVDCMQWHAIDPRHTAKVSTETLLPWGTASDLSATSTQQALDVLWQRQERFSSESRSKNLEDAKAVAT